MKKLLSLLVAFAVISQLKGQDLTPKTREAIRRLEADSQMKHALLGFYVVEDKTGKVVVNEHGEIGLAPASCQKLFTSAAALELLGTDYIYKTLLGISGNIEKGVLNGDLVITGSGDPSLGSWRWTGTGDSAVMKEFLKALQENGIGSVKGNLIADDRKFETQTIPGGWIWDDMGNYYGAGASGLNWRENQFDLYLNAGEREGDSVKILRTNPQTALNIIINELKTGPKGSGDNGYIYSAPYSINAALRGTIPPGENPFVISGSFPNPSWTAITELERYFNRNGIALSGETRAAMNMNVDHKHWPEQIQTIATHLSPPLDSINYWFLKKSINMYGEALIKTMAFEKTGLGSTDKGIDLVRDFWQSRGIDREAIHLMDGSGLSPQNRVTAHALVQVLLYARSRPWFRTFYDALPVINNLHMKSGSIGGARSYAGYMQSGAGRTYTFAIIVNNFNGPSGEMVRKIWNLLDQLK